MCRISDSARDSSEVVVVFIFSVLFEFSRSSSKRSVKRGNLISRGTKISSRWAHFGKLESWTWGGAGGKSRKGGRGETCIANCYLQKSEFSRCKGSIVAHTLKC